jgi:hypothetical protein
MASVVAPPPPPYVPSFPVMTPQESLMEKFRYLAGKYEIRLDFCEKLRQLEGFDITIICDDSGSMNTPLAYSSTGGSGAFAPRKTRYDELREYIGIAIEISSCLDSDGLDIYFLNKPPAHGVRSLEELSRVFTYPPSGSTPLVRTLQQVLHDKRGILGEKKQLIMIATDGEPDEGVRAFKDTLARRPPNTFISIIACTEDEGTMRYLNELDVIIPGLDVVDDYHSEVKEVKHYQGQDFVFTFGDYVVKTLLGPIDPYFDELDEKRNPGASATASATASGSSSGGCCSVQ